MHVAVYCGSVGAATNELFRNCRLMEDTERIPPGPVRVMFVMLHKKGPWDDYKNYRTIYLLCHSYKLMSIIVARVTYPIGPTQAPGVAVSLGDSNFSYYHHVEVRVRG